MHDVFDPHVDFFLFLGRLGQNAMENQICSQHLFTKKPESVASPEKLVFYTPGL